MTVSRVRRRLLALSGAALAAPALAGGPAPEPPDAALFTDAEAEARLAAALHRLYGARTPAPSAAVRLELPAIAEDGAIVPLGVRCELAGVAGISILCGSNPEPVIARLALHPDAEPGLDTRVKLAQSGAVLVVAECGERGLACSRRRIRVIRGGCA